MWELIKESWSQGWALGELEGRRRETRKALEQLSDKELADIGITRGDIPRIAQETE